MHSRSLAATNGPFKNPHVRLPTCDFLIPCSGGDELLPLFAYVVIRSGITFLWSESSFIETFINEKTAIEKGGYLLATLQTCLNLVNTIDIAQLQTNAKEMIGKINFFEIATAYDFSR